MYFYGGMEGRIYRYTHRAQARTVSISNIGGIYLRKNKTCDRKKQRAERIYLKLYPDLGVGVWHRDKTKKRSFQYSRCSKHFFRISIKVKFTLNSCDSKFNEKKT